MFLANIKHIALGVAVTALDIYAPYHSTFIVGASNPQQVVGDTSFLPIIIIAALLLAPIVFAAITNIVNALKER